MQTTYEIYIYSRAKYGEYDARTIAKRKEFEAELALAAGQAPALMGLFPSMQAVPTKPTKAEREEMREEIDEDEYPIKTRDVLKPRPKTQKSAPSFRGAWRIPADETKEERDKRRRAEAMVLSGMSIGAGIAMSAEQFRKEGLFAPAPEGELEKEREGMLEKILSVLLLGERASGTTIYALRKKLGLGGIDWIERKEAGELFKEISPSQALGISTPETKLLTSRGVVSFALDVLLDPTTYIGVGVIGKAGKGIKALKIGERGAKAEKTVGPLGIEYIKETIARGISRETAERKLVEAIERGQVEYLAAKKYAEPSVHILGQKLFYTRPYQRLAKQIWDIMPYAETRGRGVDILKTAFVPFHKIIRDVGAEAKKPFQQFYRKTAAETAMFGKHIEELFAKTPKTVDEEIVLALEKGIEPTSPQAKEAAVELRKIYDEAFEEQVALGMIKPEQYRELYMHHALTKEGREWMKKELGSEYERGLDIAEYRKRLGSKEKRLIEGDVYEVNKMMQEKYGIEEFFIKDPYLAAQTFGVQHVKATRSHILHRQVMEEYGRPIEELAPVAGRGTPKYAPTDVTQQLKDFDEATQHLLDENARRIAKFDEATRKITEKREADVLEFDIKTERMRGGVEAREIERTQTAYYKAEEQLEEARTVLYAPFVGRKKLEEFDEATEILSEGVRKKYLENAEQALTKAQKRWDAKKLVSKTDIATVETQMLAAKGKVEELRTIRETFELYHPMSFGEVRHPPTLAEATRGLSEKQITKYVQDREKIETLLKTAEIAPFGTPVQDKAISSIDEIIGQYTRILKGKESAAETRALTTTAKYKRFEELGIGGVKPRSYWEKKDLEYIGAIDAAKYDVEHLPAFTEWQIARTEVRDELVKKLDVAEGVERKRIAEEIEELDAITKAAEEEYMELPALAKWDTERAIKREEYVVKLIEREGVQLEGMTVKRATLEERIGKEGTARLEAREKLAERLGGAEVAAPPKVVNVDGIEHTLFKFKGEETYLPTTIVDELKRTRPATGFWTEVYDPSLGALKKTWISVWPGFYARNVYGGVGWQNILAGVEPTDYARNIDVLYGDQTKLYDVPLYGKMSGKELKEMMEEYNVYGQTGFVGEPSSYITGVGTLGRAYKKVPEQAMHLTENQLRGAVFMHYFYKTGDPEFASEMVYKYHFEYLRGAYTPFEEDVLLRTVPFGKWILGNIPLQTEMVFRQPGKYAALAKAREMATTPEEYNLLTDWQKQKIIYAHGDAAVSVDLPIFELPGLYGREEAYFGLTPFLKWGMRVLEGRDEYGRKMEPLTTREGIMEHAEMTAMTFAGRYIYAQRELEKTYKGERPLEYTIAHQLAGIGIHELKESYEQVEEAFETAKYTTPTPTKREMAVAWAAQGRVPGAKVFALPLPEEEDERVWRAVGTMPVKVNEQIVNRVIEELEGGAGGLYRLRGFGTLISLTAEEREMTKGFKPTNEQLKLIEEISELGITEEGATARDLYLEMFREHYERYESRLYRREAFTDEERMAAVARRPAGLTDLRFKEIRYETGEKAGILALTPEEYEEYGGFELSEAQKAWMFREGKPLPEEGYERYQEDLDKMYAAMITERYERLRYTPFTELEDMAALPMVKMAPSDQLRVWKEEYEAQRLQEEEWREEYRELRADPFGVSRPREGVPAALMLTRGGQAMQTRHNRAEELENLLGAGVDR